MDDLVLKVYKELKVKMEVAKFLEEIFLDEKEYLATYIDKERALEVDYQIKGTHEYYKKLKNNWEKLYNMIDEVCYSTLNDIERIVFQEKYMNNLTAEEISQKYKSLNISIQTIYNISHKIKSKLKRIRIKNWVGSKEV